MDCHRCGGTMIFKKVCDYGEYCSGWKCISCGEIIDENCQSSKIAKEQKQDKEEALCTDAEEAEQNETEFVWCGV